MDVQLLLMSAAALYGMKKTAKGNGLRKSTGNDVGKYPKSGKSRNALERIWEEGGTFYRMEFDYPYDSKLRGTFCGKENSTYEGVHLFHFRQGDWQRRHWNPDWKEIGIVTASIQAVGTALGGPIGALIAAVVNAIYAFIKVFTYYDEMDFNFCVSKKLGTSHSAIQKAIRQTFPELDVLYKENRLRHSRHYGSCRPVEWGTEKGRLVGEEEIEGKTVEWRPWTRWTVAY